MIVEPDGSIRTWTYQGNDCDRLIMDSTAVTSELSEKSTAKAD
jgi:hypothetical protein